MNLFVHTLHGKKSLAPTISVSVELLVFNFYFVDLLLITPGPIEVNPPVCHRISLCVPYNASTQVCIASNRSAPTILGMLIVPFKYFNNLPNFTQSSSVLFDTLVQRNEITKLMPSHALFDTYRNWWTDILYSIRRLWVSRDTSTMTFSFDLQVLWDGRTSCLPLQESSSCHDQNWRSCIDMGCFLIFLWWEDSFCPHDVDMDCILFFILDMLWSWFSCFFDGIVVCWIDCFSVCTALLKNRFLLDRLYPIFRFKKNIDEYTNYFIGCGPP